MRPKLPRLAILAAEDPILNYQQTQQQLPESTQIIVYADGKHTLQHKMALITEKMRHFLHQTIE